jgi:purine-nucleoside phosphorylase
VERALSAIRKQTSIVPEVGLITGSGMGFLADAVDVEYAVPYRELPGFPPTTVAGHGGRLVLGILEGRRVCALDGRFHYYEGHSMRDVAAGVHLLHGLGAGELLLTNAAGIVNRRFTPGLLMVVSDHLNLMWRNPLIGRAPGQIRDMFPDMSEPYNPELRHALLDAAVDLRIAVVEGVYAAVSGPSYETPAEVDLLHRIGADAVGMSTVPEVISARELGLRVAALSCLTNYAAGLGPRPLGHEEVLEVAGQVRPRLERLLAGFLRRTAASVGADAPRGVAIAAGCGPA